MTLQNISRDQEKISRFAAEVIVKLNVNLSDPEYETKVYTAEISRYAAQSKLTPSEFFLARTALSRGYLRDISGTPLKAYKKIDFEIFNEVEEVYLRYKVENTQYEKGKEQIKAFLNPPPPEPTEEEKKAHRAQLRNNVERCFAEHSECEFAFLIYDDLKNEGVLEEFRKPEIVADIQSRIMGKFLQKEITRNLFYNAVELRELTDKFKKGEKYKVPEIVKQEVKNEIIKRYYDNRPL